MDQYLHKYFALHKKISLPGIGVFAAVAEPAQLDFTERLLHAPKYSVQYFETEDTEVKDFCHFLATEKNISDADAEKSFNRFLQKLQNVLATENSLHLKGIGTIAGNAGVYNFIAETNDLLQPINAERVIRKNAEHTIKVGEAEKTSTQMQELLQHTETKDRWWIAAVLLAALGTGAILYYYLGR